MTRVLIIDNHELVRRGLAALVQAEDDMTACGEVACTEAAFDAVLQCRPDVVVIDVSAVHGAGLQVIQQIRRHDRKIRIVALAMSEKPELVERSLSAGAAVFVEKAGLAVRVLEAIRRTCAATATEAAVGERPAGAGRTAGTAPKGCLDAIEREIVGMIGRGVPTRGIAVRLGMSVATVEDCRRRIRSKLNFPTATQLVQFCVQWTERNARVS